MGGNRYSKLSDPTLNITVGATTSYLIEEYASYGVTEADVQVVDEANAELATKISLQETLDAAKLAGTQAKFAARSSVIDLASNLAAKIYANPAVDDSMLVKAGLAPRPVHSGAKPLVAVATLDAFPSANGDVLLRWDRSGNSATVNFVVESRQGSTGPFSFVVSTTRTRLKLSGYEPGVTVTFRVVATRSNLRAASSPPAVIYAEGMESSFLSAA